MSDLEFVITHIVTRPFQFSPYHESTFAEMRIGVALLDRYPAFDDHSMPACPVPLTQRFPLWDLLMDASDTRTNEVRWMGLARAQAMTVFEYKRYRVEIGRVGKGWTAAVRARIDPRIGR